MCLDDADVIENDGDVCSRFDYVLWCGDLNYRVDLSRNETQAMLEKADYMVRNLQDGLTQCIATPAALHSKFGEIPLRSQSNPVTFMSVHV